MLLTDGSPNNTEDLRVHESAILDVAHTERIEIDTKLALALEEVSEDILDALLDQSRASDPELAVRRQIGVSDVVVTAQLKRWHAVHTLEVMYRDAFNNQLNDRYQPKFTEYHNLSRNAREHTFRFGIGLSLAPIPKAAVPRVTSTPSSLPAATYYIEVSWVSAGGQEGAPSDTTTFDAAAGNAPVVTAVNAPGIASGFNVYMGATFDSLMRQTSTPIPVGGSFTLPGNGLATGPAPGTGQLPDTYVTVAQAMRRG